MLARRGWTVYVGILTVCHLIASMVYLVASAVAYNKDACNLTKALVGTFCAYIVIGIIVAFVTLVKKCTTIGAILYLLISVLQIYFFVAAMVDWQDFLARLLQEEHFPFQVTQFVADHEALVKVFLILGVPFYVLGSVGLLILSKACCFVCCF